ncbi:MAG TPA: LLM class flavin-dependent oxidoreductase [Acidimicrobiales bacterium]
MSDADSTTGVPLGVTFASLTALGTAGAVDVASEARALGYDSFWAAEVTGEEAFALLGHVGALNPGLGLGTGVVALQLRTPPLAAMAAATLQALDPSREVILGVGISSPVVAGRWHGATYGDRPLAQVREYLHVVRELLSGEAVTHDGDFYRLSRSRLTVRLGERKPKLVLGALNPGMLRLAGETADGVLLNYLPSSHVPWSIDHVRAGEAKAGRPAGSCEVFAYVHAGVCERGQNAVAAAQRDLFSYAVVDAYAASFTRAGFAAEVDAVRAAHAERDRQGALAAVSDAFIDAIDFVGTGSEVAAFVARYVAAGVERPVLMPLPWGDDRRATVTATLPAARSGCQT